MQCLNGAKPAAAAAAAAAAGVSLGGLLDTIEPYVEHLVECLPASQQILFFGGNTRTAEYCTRSGMQQAQARKTASRKTLMMQCAGSGANKQERDGADEADTSRSCQHRYLNAPFWLGAQGLNTCILQASPTLQLRVHHRSILRKFVYA